MSPFDPNADFYSGSRPPAAPEPFRPPFGSPGVPAAPVAHAVPPAVPPAPRVPTWGKVLIGLGIGFAALTVLGIVAAVAIPVFLSQHAKAADSVVKQDLRAVAQAEENVWMATGSYTGDPAALDVAEPASQVAILAADPQGYCLAGRDAQGHGRVWYYSSAAGLSRTACA
ncbi:type IV pilin protein [Kineococcus aurantiacus]|uniref:Tfp pilus assembly protein PilE n=1 Tax=Kineococcus aurantiacus TaxID=37633 RepID=A0A7Y9ARR7_9ACTN|nr:hypothetical protein [Kineococcus aurantiacus]NYD20810.1 Tfp pilus assembly protein PilE [Kineococcus aurantiacus]